MTRIGEGFKIEEYRLLIFDVTICIQSQDMYDIRGTIYDVRYTIYDIRGTRDEVRYTRSRKVAGCRLSVVGFELPVVGGFSAKIDTVCATCVRRVCDVCPMKRLKHRTHNGVIPLTTRIQRQVSVAYS
jgi:hypothetical protein